MIDEIDIFIGDEEAPQGEVNNITEKLEEQKITAGAEAEGAGK